MSWAVFNLLFPVDWSRTSTAPPEGRGGWKDAPHCERTATMHFIGAEGCGLNAVVNVV